MVGNLWELTSDCWEGDLRPSCVSRRLLELLCRGYVSFEVRDPKRRLISAAPFRDRWCTTR